MLKSGLILAVLLVFAVPAALAANCELPVYACSDGDPLETAVARYVADFGYAANTYRPAGSFVVVPSPVILKVDYRDSDTAQVYGNFWWVAFTLEDTTLQMVSAAENPGVMTLERKGGRWTVARAEFAGDGNASNKDIARFSFDDPELKTAYLISSDLTGSLTFPVYMHYLHGWVRDSGLNVTACRDFAHRTFLLSE